jgi:hypothetical protein
MDRAITTCRLPLDRRKGNAITRPYIPGHLASVYSDHLVPRGPRSYGLIGKELGRTRRHDEPPPILSSKPQQTYIMNV